MSDMPERIWADGDYEGIWNAQNEEGFTEYVRADLVDAEIARLREAGDALLDAHSEAHDEGDIETVYFYGLVGIWDAAKEGRNA